MIQSTPASPYDQRRLPTSSEMNGLAESLIGGVSTKQKEHDSNLYAKRQLLVGTRR